MPIHWHVCGAMERDAHIPHGKWNGMVLSQRVGRTGAMVWQVKPPLVMLAFHKSSGSRPGCRKRDQKQGTKCSPLTMAWFALPSWLVLLSIRSWARWSSVYLTWMYVYFNALDCLFLVKFLEFYMFQSHKKWLHTYFSSIFSFSVFTFRLFDSQNAQDLLMFIWANLH